MKNKEIKPKFVNETGAAAYLGLQGKEISKLVEMGEITPIQIPTRIYPLYSIAQLDSFVDRMYSKAVEKRSKPNFQRAI